MKRYLIRRGSVSDEYEVVEQETVFLYFTNVEIETVISDNHTSLGYAKEYLEEYLKESK